MEADNSYIREEGGNFIFSVPKERISEGLIQRIANWLKAEQILEYSQMSEEEAWLLAEEVKVAYGEEESEKEEH